MRVAMRREHFFSERIKRGKVAFLWNSGRQPGPGAAFLLIEHVDRNVLRPEIEHAIEIALPGLQLLSGNPRDEIEIDVREPLTAQHLEIGEDRRRLVQTSRSREIFIFERLSAE